MSNALVGHTGFVGATLKRQAHFKHLFNSSNIDQVGRQGYETVVCAAAPAQKWIANRDPEADWQNIEKLIENLDSVRCERFVLISTVDVFSSPLAVDESLVIDTSALQPYGLHRYRLEEFVRQRFDSHLVVRLPGLVGPGLRKNALFDLHNDNNVAAIDSRGQFQFYPMVNLNSDLELALDAGLSLLHLTSEPVTVAEIAEQAFSMRFNNPAALMPPRYDMRSLHDLGRGRASGYQYDRRDVIQAIRAYHQYEPLDKTLAP